MVLGGSLAFESYSKHKKKLLPQILSLPPRARHLTQPRLGELRRLREVWREARRRGEGVVYIVGPPGSGKTELACQYGQQFIQQSLNVTHRFRICKPAVLCLEGSTSDGLKLGLQEAAVCLGIRELDTQTVGGDEGEQEVLALAKTLQNKLKANGVPWLIIVDNLTLATQQMFQSVFHSSEVEWDWGLGGVLVTSSVQPPPPGGGEPPVLHISEWYACLDTGENWGMPCSYVILSKKTIFLQSEYFSLLCVLEIKLNCLKCLWRLCVSSLIPLLLSRSAYSMEKDEALALLQSLSPSTDFSCPDSSNLSPLLSSSPLSLALAAATINMYSASLEQEGSPQTWSPLEQYLELLAEDTSPSLPSPDQLTKTCLRLYVEAAATDPQVMHTFDLLGSLSPAHPVPASLLYHHLSSSPSSSFYRLPPLPPPTLPTPPSQDMSFWAQLKMMLPFGQKTPSSPSLLASFDQLHHIRNSPILSFKKYSSEGFELVQLHSEAREELSSQFINKTVPRMERAQLEEARVMFHNTAWFRNCRRFDEEKALVQYRRALPGVSGAGVMMREEFMSSPLATNLTYSDYLHTVSHVHRVSSSIISQLKILDDGFASSHFCRYIEPHLDHLGSQLALPASDRALCQYGLASVSSVLSSPQEAGALYQSVLEQQRRALGPSHPAVARTLTDMAGLLFAKEDVQGAQELLETSLRIYSSLTPKSASSEVKIDHGLALASLAVVVSCRGEKRRSRDLLEEALSLYQTMPESGEVSVYQRRLVAGTLTDLSHAYLGLGQIVLAQKYVELAMLAMPNVYPQGSSETVRALTVAGAVYALLGDKRESQRVGQEAGKEKARLDKQQLVFM